LRLVGADDKHLPNFVCGKPITITDTAHDKALDPTSLGRYGARMALVGNLPTGKVLASAVPVSFVVE
jgi:hypothetical protein